MGIDEIYLGKSGKFTVTTNLETGEPNGSEATARRKLSTSFFVVS